MPIHAKTLFYPQHYTIHQVLIDKKWPEDKNRQRINEGRLYLDQQKRLNLRGKVWLIFGNYEVTDPEDRRYLLELAKFLEVDPEDEEFFSDSHVCEYDPDSDYMERDGKWVTIEDFDKDDEPPPLE